MEATPPVVRVGIRTGRALLFAATAAFVWSPAGYGFAEFAGGLLNLNASAEITADSNAFGDTSDESDVFFTGRPELRWEREGARVVSSIAGGVAINRYSDFSELNSEDWFLNGAIRMPPNIGRLSGALTISYFDGSEADVFIGQRADIERLNASLSTSYDLTGRTAVRFGAGRTSFDSDVRRSVASNSIRGGVSMRIAPTLSAFLDYIHSSSSSSSNSALPGEEIDYRTQNIMVGLDGEITATLNGSVSIGYEMVDARGEDAGGDDDNFAANVELTWTPRQTTQVALSGGRQTRVTAAAESIESLMASLRVRQELGIALNAVVGLTWETFDSRVGVTENDDRLVAELGFEYSVQDRLGFGAGVRHNTRSSDNEAFDIDRTQYYVSGRVTF